MQDLKLKIENLLKLNLPVETFIKVQERKFAFGGEQYLGIMFSVPYLGDMAINNCASVSLRLEYDMTLETQIYGGCGGRCITREIDPNDQNEKYFACKDEKISFRKPKQEYKFVEKAIIKFAENFLLKILEVAEKGLLRDIESHNYEPFIEAGKNLKNKDFIKKNKKQFKGCEYFEKLTRWVDINFNDFDFDIFHKDLLGYSLKWNKFGVIQSFEEK